MEHKLLAGNATLRPEIIDREIAPGICEFTAAEIKTLTDVFPNQNHWIQDYCLNALFQARYSDQIRPLIFQSIRRASACFYFYHKAAEKTKEYFTKNCEIGAKTYLYFDILNYWEVFLIQAQVCIDLNNKLRDDLSIKERVFIRKDGSRDQRLYDIANYIKHSTLITNSNSNSGELVVPLWLTNEGFRTTGLSLTYEEAYEMLYDISTMCDKTIKKMCQKSKNKKT